MSLSLNHKKCKSHALLLVFILLIYPILSSCDGGECAATSNPLSDADGDCAPDSSDNCPLIYNPAQVDGDEDGIGLACDQDDSDDTIGSLESISQLVLTDSILIPKYLFPNDQLVSKETYQTQSTTCQYMVIGCDDNLLGYLNPDDTLLENSILDDFSFYGRPLTSCSAFNDFAKYPPAIYCAKTSQNLQFVGYLTTNSNILQGIDTCQVLQDLNKFSNLCD